MRAVPADCLRSWKKEDKIYAASGKDKTAKVSNSELSSFSANSTQWEFLNEH